MPATGREFGLEVNISVDERYHIEKATVAACNISNKRMPNIYRRLFAFSMCGSVRLRCRSLQSLPPDYNRHKLPQPLLLLPKQYLI